MIRKNSEKYLEIALNLFVFIKKGNHSNIDILEVKLFA